jgi:molecular chaperone DnaJ
MVVEIVVETPTKLSRRQKEILEEFKATETGDECPESRSFFAKLKDAFGG